MDIDIDMGNENENENEKRGEERKSDEGNNNPFEKWW